MLLGVPILKFAKFNKRFLCPYRHNFSNAGPLRVSEDDSVRDRPLCVNSTSWAEVFVRIWRTISSGSSCSLLPISRYSLVLVSIAFRLVFWQCFLNGDLLSVIIPRYRAGLFHGMQSPCCVCYSGQFLRLPWISTAPFLFGLITILHFTYLTLFRKKSEKSFTLIAE